jgi:4-hydroxybenzoate polyprenyltransferase
VQRRCERDGSDVSAHRTAVVLVGRSAAAELVQVGVQLLVSHVHSVAVGASSLALVFTYPLAKRYTFWPQLILGLTFNWGCLLGWSAVQGHIVDWPAVLALYIGAINWTLVYDTIYAHQDKHDDMLIGVKSTALRFGENTKYWLSAFTSASTACIGLSGYLCNQSPPFYVALTAMTAHLFWQVWSVNINDSSDCWSKFRTNQWLGLILFGGIAIGTYCKHEKSESQLVDAE